MKETKPRITFCKDHWLCFALVKARNDNSMRTITGKGSTPQKAWKQFAHRRFIYMTFSHAFMRVRS